MSVRAPTETKINRKWNFVSYKSGAMLGLRSYLQYCYCFHLEFNPLITKFLPRPPGFDYSLNGISYHCCPDFIANLYKENKSIYIELERNETVLRPSFGELFKIKQSASEKRGFPLELVDDCYILQQPLLTNLQLIFRYNTIQPLSAKHRELLSALTSEPVLISDLSMRFGNELLMLFCGLLAKHEVTTNMNKPINFESLVWRVQK